MKHENEYAGFEQGPIRPPSEAESLLFRVTANCPWNRCTFCSIYKGRRFRLRPVEHILKDIDAVKKHVDRILQERAGEQIATRRQHRKHVDGDRGDLRAFHAAYNFISGGMQSIFLQDADSLVIKPERTLRILSHLKQSFPMVKRITTYARSKTISRMDMKQLERMAAYGLNRIHIGMESGADIVLEKVKKGVDKATHIRAGQKVKQAGIQLSEYYMPGLGGALYSTLHAEESADALNQINPDFIRIRTLAIADEAPLQEDIRNNSFQKLGEVDTVREFLMFLENLKDVTCKITSDHTLNLFPEVEGVLPGDMERMQEPLLHFLGLDEKEQMIFCIGRRTQVITRLCYLNDVNQRQRAIEMCERLQVTPDSMDSVIDQLMRRFI